MTHFAMAGHIYVFCFQFPSMCERIKLQMFDWYVAGVGFICQAKKTGLFEAYRLCVDRQHLIKMYSSNCQIKDLRHNVATIDSSVRHSRSRRF